MSDALLKRCLDDLEQRIDEAEEGQLWAAWRTFAEGRCREDVFLPRRSRPRPPGFDWPHRRINECLADPERMLVQQLESCSRELASGGGMVLCIRANYGTGTLPSLFGGEPFIMDDAANTLPGVRHLPGGAAMATRLLAEPAPDLRAGLGGSVFDTADLFRERLQSYPKLRRWAPLYHPDLQGPMDVCELLWGSELFVDLVDHPETVHALLRRITDTYERFMREWDRRVPPLDGVAAHWGFLHGGRILLRDDSAVNLSPAMFEEFILPYDQRLLSAFGGGVIHFCGKGDHFIGILGGMKDLRGVQLSEPHQNDMEKVFAATVDRRVPLYNFASTAVAEARARNRPLRGLVQSS